MVDRFEQQERYGADLVCVSKARAQSKGRYQPKPVPAKSGAQPHSRVKELPAQAVRDQQDNMFEQQHNMLQDEVVSISPFIQQHQQQQQLQLQHQQHNIARNPVIPKHQASFLRVGYDLFHGAKALSSKISSEGLFGQLRHCQRKFKHFEFLAI